MWSTMCAGKGVWSTTCAGKGCGLPCVLGKGGVVYHVGLCLKYTCAMTATHTCTPGKDDLRSRIDAIRDTVNTLHPAIVVVMRFIFNFLYQ